MTRTLVLLSAAAVAGALGLLATPAPRRVVATPVPLDERTLVFREDVEPWRAVGEVRAALLAGGEGVRLRVVASAVGPHVDAAPGPEGVRGGNRITAEELDALLARGGLTLRALGPHGEPAAAGAPPATRRGPLLVRTIDAAGHVAHVPAGGGALATEAAVESSALAEGISRVEVVADGRVRVRAVVRVQGREGRVLALEQVADGEARP